MRRLIVPDRPPAQLALTDAAAILVFVLVGLASHRDGIAANFAGTALPLLGAWFAAALVFRAYRRPSIGRLLATWIVAIPLGVLIRALVLGHALNGEQAAFLVVALVFTLLFVVAARAAVELTRPGD